MHSKPVQHFQHEYDADHPSAGFLPDSVLMKWFNDSYSTSKHLLSLYTLARGLNAKHILEVGFGRSTPVLARAAAENGGRMVCVDQRDFSYALNADELRVVTFVNGLSGSGRALFSSTGIDFVFLDYFSDANVKEDFVRAEIQETLSLLRQNGLLCVHDALIDSYAVKSVLQELKTGRFGFHNRDLEIVTLPFNYGMGVIRRVNPSPFGTLNDVFLKKPEPSK